MGLLDEVVDGLGMLAVGSAREGGEMDEMDEMELTGEGVGHAAPITGVLLERRKSGV